jgi:hypothetical protein
MLPPHMPPTPAIKATFLATDIPSPQPVAARLNREHVHSLIARPNPDPVYPASTRSAEAVHFNCNQIIPSLLFVGGRLANDMGRRMASMPTFDCFFDLQSIELRPDHEAAMLLS